MTTTALQTFDSLPAADILSVPIDLDTILTDGEHVILAQDDPHNFGPLARPEA